MKQVTTVLMAAGATFLGVLAALYVNDKFIKKA